MDNQKRITCIVCPLSCKILVKTNKKRIELVHGNKCKKGIEYARSEALDPRRMLTSTVLVKYGDWPLVSVKSSKPIPKDIIYKVLNEIKKISISAPVKMGQIIISNVAGTNINIIATKNIKKEREVDYI